MTWPTAQLFSWIERIEARAPRSSFFELLELGPSADTGTISEAFHRIAAGAHPDLHRKTLSPADAERLVRAYGKIAAAYDTLRDPGTRERYRRELAERGRPTAQAPVIGGSQPIPIQRPVTAAAALAGRADSASLGYGDPAIARTTTPPSQRITLPPDRARTPSPAPMTARAATAPLPSMTRPPAPTRGSTSPPATARPPTGPPASSRTPTTPPSVARTTTPPSVARTTTPSRAPVDSRSPLITPAPVTVPPQRTRPPSPGPRSGATSRPPHTGVGPRAQIYFRKAQACLAQGDLGGALFNLRLAAAADPGSALIRVALGEVEAELGGKK